jgi:enamine deaminase RidA (YjgF/YER057c/UK114 family)
MTTAKGKKVFLGHFILSIIITVAFFAKGVAGAYPVPPQCLRTQAFAEKNGINVDALPSVGFSAIDMETHIKLHLSATPRKGITLSHQFMDIIDYLEEALTANGGDLENVVYATVFLKDVEDIEECRWILREYFGDSIPPVNFVGQPSLEKGKRVAFEAWAVIPTSLVVTINRITEHTTIVEEEGAYVIYTGDITAGEEKGIYSDEVDQAFLNMKKEFQAIEAYLKARGAQRSVSFDKFVRAWFYNSDLLEKDPASPRKNRYMDFNTIRTGYYGPVRFIEDILDPDFVENDPQFLVKTKAYPASTGIGVKRPFLFTMGFIALVPKEGHPAAVIKAAPVSNKEQTTPADYSADYGPDSPKFSRGTIVEMGDRAIFYISGTASIRKADTTTKKGNPIAQTETTIDNIRILISRENLELIGLKGWGATLEDIAQLRIYIRNPEDYGAVKMLCEKAFPHVPKVYINADVCRPDLDVEIEGVAYLTRQSAKEALPEACPLGGLGKDRLLLTEV